MTTVGVTGHQDGRGDPTWEWTAGAIAAALDQVEPPLIGVSSLAAGADQVFGRCVLAAGGALHAVIPFEDYDTQLLPPWREEFRALLRAARRVETLRGLKGEDAYLAAGERVIALSDSVIAVWDGEPAGGTGGTGDIVVRALHAGRRVIHINPVNRTETVLGG